MTIKYTKIFICGFMGSGKTTFLKLIKTPNYKKIDLDKRIEKLVRTPIPQFIKKYGLFYFRVLESLALQEILNNNEKVIVALGGGSLTPSNIKKLNKYPNLLIWIKRPLFKILNNLPERPLAEKGNNFLRKLYKKRKKLYKQSNIILNFKSNLKGRS